ncbi:VanZ family protein [Haloarchaeobius sp. HRN-SO-5]|uniref:VanZ family protein n=1 Tax=Haloarchaeobius sp. HRN-SO-5 TaxID=3446118 RepID=UPI003EC08533
MFERIRRADGRWLHVAVVGALLFVGSVVPLPSRSRPRFGPFGPDKGVHLLAHAWLAAAIAAALDEDEPGVPAAASAVLLSTVFGFVIEVLQARVPGRMYERADVVSGFVGSVVGVACLPSGGTRNRN